MAGGNFGGGDGTASRPYLVEDAQDFLAIEQGKTLNYLQANDIDFSGVSSIPRIDMLGTYDGNGFKFKNLSLIGDGVSTLVFYSLTGTLRNLEIDSSCYLECTSGPHRIAAFSSYVGDGSILNCVNRADIKNVSGFAAGIAALNAASTSSSSNPVLSDCFNYGKITGTSAAGIHAALGRASLTRCYNAGDVTATSTSGYAAGISWGAKTYTDCKNSGRVTGIDKSAGIGIFPNNTRTGAMSFTRCINTGNVAGSSAGGIVSSGHTGVSTPHTVDSCFALNDKLISSNHTFKASDFERIAISTNYYEGMTPLFDVKDCYANENMVIES